MLMTRFVLVTCPKCGHMAEIMYVKNAIWKCLKCRTETKVEKAMGQKRLTDFQN